MYITFRDLFIYVYRLKYIYMGRMWTNSRKIKNNLNFIKDLAVLIYN